MVGISAQEGKGPKEPSVRGEGTQEPWRRGATGCSMLSRQLQFEIVDVPDPQILEEIVEVIDELVSPVSGGNG